MARRRRRTEEDAQALVHFGLPPDGTISLAAALATTFHPEDGPRYAAPHPATVFGGILDVSGAADLRGRRVLVVEDDYYMANDTAAALRGAGAQVLGPCPSVDAALDLLETNTPTHAVLDLNLGGGGPRFEIANLLKARGVPFIFLTGYDPDVIPEALEDVVQLQKPAAFRAIVEAVGSLAWGGGRLQAGVAKTPSTSAAGTTAVARPVTPAPRSPPGRS